MRFDDFAENIISNYETDFGSNTQTIKQAITQLKSGDISDQTVDFDMAEERENIVRGESLRTIFGKIKKWFNDLKSGAFLPVINNLTTAESNQGSLDAYQGKVLKDTIDGYGDAKNYDVADNLTTSEPGEKVLDAHQGKVLDTSITTLRTEVNAFRNKTIANNFSTAESGLKVLDAYRGKILSDRFDYAYIKFSGSYNVSAGSTPRLVAETDIKIGKGDSSAYFQTVEHYGNSWENPNQVTGKFLKFKQGNTGSSYPYLVICQCYFSYSSSNSDDDSCKLQIASKSISGEMLSSVPGGVTGRGKMGYDINSVSRITEHFNSTDEFGMFVYNTAGGELRDGKIFIFPLFYANYN